MQRKALWQETSTKRGNLWDLFPDLTSVRAWDIEDGDAVFMKGVADDSFDCVHSSHCLEHLSNPVEALKNWIRICKVGGHLVISVPDEDLYEQGYWPSKFNPEHQWSFTIAKPSSWSPVSVNVLDLVKVFSGSVQVLKIELLDHDFDYGAETKWDQTLGAAECGIEFVLRKIA